MNCQNPKTFSLLSPYYTDCRNEVIKGQIPEQDQDDVTTMNDARDLAADIENYAAIVGISPNKR